MIHQCKLEACDVTKVVVDHGIKFPVGISHSETFYKLRYHLYSIYIN